MDFAAESEGGHIFFCGKHILIDDRGSGFHGVGHLVGDVVLDHSGGVGGHDGPEQQHANQSDGAGDDADASGKFFCARNFTIKCLLREKGLNHSAAEESRAAGLFHRQENLAGCNGILL